MIERKRRNDFVRKRELDMLRKIRREGLSQDSALALSASNLDSDSRPQQNSTRSDVAVKAKIDEFELQMVGGSARQLPPNLQPAAVPSMAGRLDTTAPNYLTVPDTLPVDDDDRPPQISQAVLDAARNHSPRMTGPGALNPPTVGAAFSGSNSGVDLEVQVHEVAHDPELDEAVIAFANADFDQCERCLLDLVNPGSARHDQPETWLVLFDLYRTLDLPHKFESLAVSFAQKFGVSAPQWYSLPQKVAAFLARRDQASAPTQPMPPEE